MADIIQNCFNCDHMKKVRNLEGLPCWRCELMDKARAIDIDGDFHCEDYKENLDG